MKRLTCFFLILCLILPCCAAFAKGTGPSFQVQPKDQTVKKGGKCVFSIRVKDTKGITWYFVDPTTGEEFYASQASKKIKGLKVSGYNGTKLVLKKVPESLHGWSVYCQISSGAAKVKSNYAMILIKGMEPPAQGTTPVAQDNGNDTPGQDNSKNNNKGRNKTAPTATPNPNRRPEYTITANNAVLYKTDDDGNPKGDPQTSLTFTGTSSFYVKAEGPVEYWSFNSIKVTPDNPSENGLLVRGIAEATIVRAHIAENVPASTPDPAAATPQPVVTPEPPVENVSDDEGYGEGYDDDYPEEGEDPEDAGEEKYEPYGGEDTEPSIYSDPSESDGSSLDDALQDLMDDEGYDVDPEDEDGEDAAPVAETAPQAPSAPAEGMCHVTCENCRFSGYGLSYVSEGDVPAGTEITVVATAQGNIDAGYSVNGKPYDNKGKVTVRLTVNEDTSIVMKPSR